MQASGFIYLQYILSRVISRLIFLTKKKKEKGKGAKRKILFDKLGYRIMRALCFLSFSLSSIFIHIDVSSVCKIDIRYSRWKFWENKRIKKYRK